MTQKTQADGSVVKFVDEATFNIVPPPDTFSVTDLKTQMNVLQERLVQVGSNFDAQKEAALEDIQKDIDALQAKLDQAASVGCVVE